jgi:hypothetical protein
MATRRLKAQSLAPLSPNAAGEVGSWSVWTTSQGRRFGLRRGSWQLSSPAFVADSVKAVDADESAPVTCPR